MLRNSLSYLLVCAAFANPLTYPKDGQWNFSLGLENGIESSYAYDFDQATSSQFLPYTSFYKVRSTHTAGYGTWFYLQSRIAYSVGYTGFLDFSGHMKQHDFFDYDLSLLIPVRIPSRCKITLQPQVGIAFLGEILRAEYATGAKVKRKLRYGAPLLGLMLGLEPMDRLSLRAGLNVQFPKAKTQVGVTEAGDWHELGAARHSINFVLNASFQLSKYFNIATTVERNSFSIYSQRDGGYNTAQAHRSSWTIGGRWSF